MNSKLIYDKIIAKALLTKRVKDGTIYYEEHHIIPKCLGGSEDVSNKVLLTAREHFLLHWLLIKIYPHNQKLRFAFHMMSVFSHARKQEKRMMVSSRMYKTAKETFLDYKENYGAIKMQHLKKYSEYVWIKKASECKRLHKDSKELKERLLSGWERGRIIVKRISPSEETRNKIASSNKGKPSFNKGKTLSSKGKSYEELMGEDKAKKVKQQRSKQKRGVSVSKYNWILTSPVGDVYVVDTINLDSFMKTFNSEARQVLEVFRMSDKRGKPIHHGMFKGWSARKISKI
jgi:NUMOD3 motif